MHSLLTNYHIDILGISESWLNHEVSDSFLNIPGYEIARSDSHCGTKKHGVAVYIKRGCKYQIVDCNVNNVLVVYLTSYNVYVITAYRPPSYVYSENCALINFLTNFSSDKEIYLQGDFNLPSIKWYLSDVFSSYVTPLETEFYEAFISIGLTQIVKCGTYYPSGNILDLCLVSDEERVLSCEVLPPLPQKVSHCPVLVKFLFQNLVDNSDAAGLPERLWSKGRYDCIAQVLNNVDWESELLALPCDGQYSRFLNIVKPLIDNFVPLRDSTKVSSVPWSKNPPRRL